MSDDRTVRATRMHRTARAIKKQIRIAKTAWNSSQLLKQPHRFAKSHALDCGNPKCFVCHSDKLSHKTTLQEKKFIEGHRDEDL